MKTILFPCVSFLLFATFLTLPSHVHGMLEGLYCGTENCYDILGVTRDTPKSELSKAYRKLAKIYHPDRHRSQEDKAEATERFKQVATAYEVLKDEESRNDYNYMLDNPDEYYRHYYHYYRRRMTPKVDVRYVVFVSISVVSAFQYYTALFRWNSGMKYLAQQPKYRKLCLEQAETEGLLESVKKLKKRNKEEMKAEEEKIIRSILETKMDIRGGYAKPTVYSILWLQLLLLPYTIFVYLIWYFKWIWKFQINKEEYGLEEKLYIIRKLMGFSETQFEAVPEADKDEYIDQELWIKENFIEWKTERDEERKRVMAESGRVKSYRRYIKKHGNGRMYFDDS